MALQQEHVLSVGVCSATVEHDHVALLWDVPGLGRRILLGVFIQLHGVLADDDPGETLTAEEFVFHLVVVDFLVLL